MLFFKKKKPVVSLTPSEVAKNIFGSETVVLTQLKCQTAEKYPFLSRWGTNAECDYHVQGQYGELNFEFSFPLKVYTTERAHKVHHYGFWGSCLTVSSQLLQLRNTYAYSGKPFCAPDSDSWFYNNKFKGVSIWSENMPLSAAEMDIVKHFVSWVESGMSAMASARYAIFCKQYNVSVVFWEPELYDFESQLNILRDHLKCWNEGCPQFDAIND